MSSLKPTAKIAREIMRRQKGYAPDPSINLADYGFDDNTTPEEALAKAAQLNAVPDNTAVPEKLPTVNNTAVPEKLPTVNNAAVPEKLPTVNDATTKVPEATVPEAPKMEYPKPVSNTVMPDAPTSKYQPDIDKIYNDIMAGGNEYYDAAGAMEKPVYESKYDGQIAGLVDSILNGEKFDYDVNKDSRFQNYAQIYERNAKKSAENMMGNASAASGGYGNSYAAAAAGQAYNEQMQGLNAVVPELEQLAYEQFQAKKNDQYNQLNMLNNLENQDYSRHRNDVGDFYTERDYQLSMGDRHKNDLYNQFGIVTDLADAEYNRWYQGERDKINDAHYDQEFNYGVEKDAYDRDYQQYRDAVSDKQYADEVAYRDKRDAIEDERYAGEVAYRDERDAVEDKRYDDNKALENAMTAAEMGDFSILGKILGIDTTAAENWYKQSMALDVYSATGIVGILKDAGFDTTEIEKNMQNDEFKTDLSIALSVYDATGNPAMLNKLGIDTAYMDELLQLDLATAKKGASGSGSSGKSSGSSSGGTYDNSSYTEEYIYGEMTASEVAAEIAHHFAGQGVAWNSRTVSDYISKTYPGLTIEQRQLLNAYLADGGSGLEELYYTGLTPRK